MSAPVQLIVAAFNDAEEAGRLLDELKEGRRTGLIGVVDAAAVVKDAEGQLKITNAKHRGRRGFFTGGAIGGTLALLSGPLGWATAAGGGVLGALIGKVRNVPFRANVEDLAESLSPNSSLLVAVVEHRWVEMIEAMVAGLGAAVVREELKADIAEQLDAGGNVAFTFAANDTGVAGGRMAQAADGTTEVTGFLASDDGILLTEAELTAETLPSVEVPEATADDDGQDDDGQDADGGQEPIDTQG
ncbi:MAG: DUF1269 domain-containing protein [Nitriliruptoraceae bacterium]